MGDESNDGQERSVAAESQAPQGAAQHFDDSASIAGSSIRSYGTSRSRNSRGYITNGFRQRRRDDGRPNQRGFSRDSRDFRGRSRSESRGRDFRNNNRGNASASTPRNVSNSRDRRERSQSWSRGNQRFKRSDSCSVQGRDYDHDAPRRSRSASRSNFRDGGLFNRYRSQSRGRSPGRRAPSQPETIEWPPCFDDDGTAFVFDPRSAMFYESQSDFFYDPKSKLYYGNKKGAYFRYDESVDPPFVEVQRVAAPASQTAPEASSLEPALTLDTPASKEASNQKPGIAIKLKTKKLGKKKAEGPKVETIVPKIKEQVANIEKWTEKQAELKEQTEQENPITSPGTDKPVKTTAKGEPICVICKRKFPTIDKLRLHERASELHKQNLAKIALAKTAAKRKEAPPAEYQDRAQKRRELHGPTDTATMGLNQGSIPLEAQASPSTDALGKDNIGNQLLQKLGWKSETAKESADGAGDALRRDWEQIEAKASGRQAP